MHHLKLLNDAKTVSFSCFWLHCDVEDYMEKKEKKPISHSICITTAKNIEMIYQQTLIFLHNVRF